MRMLLLLLAVLLLAGCSNNPAVHPIIKISAPIVKSSATDKSPASATADPAQPVSIFIPALRVEAPIQSVGLNEEGRMETIPSAETIGWYKYGSTPGQEGNSILAGHRDWKGKSGTFRNIEKLHTGDKVEITFDDGSIKAFTVISSNTYFLDDVPQKVMKLSGEERTTLITCTGRFDKKAKGYQSRAIVVLRGKSK